MKKYCAIIFDVVDSKKYENRLAVQKIIKNSINYLNKYFYNDIKKNVIFGAGDEFQGLFKSVDTAYLYARKLQLLIYPIQVRCGIGLGTTKYMKTYLTSTEIDGEAYYNAREAILSIPNKGSSVIFFKLNSYFDKYINMYSLASTKIKNKQSEMARLIELFTDIYHPLKKKEDIIKYTENDINFYKEILRLKHVIFNELKFTKKTSPVLMSFDEVYSDIHLELLFKTFYSKLIFNDSEKSVESDLYIEAEWPRGISTLLAYMLNTSRQNIDKHISLGDIKESRNMEYAIVKLLGENIWQ